MTQLVRGAWGPFLSIRDGDGIHVKPWEAWPRDIDAITLCPQGDNVYALQMSNGKYMSATNGGGSTITCDAVTIGPNEKFTFQWLPGNNSYLIWCPDGVHGLDAPNLVGQYLTAYYAPGGWGGQFCFHKFDEWGENKYSVWAYCSDDIGPGIFWPELSRPNGLPTYQQVIPPVVVDVFEYTLCDDSVYSKPTSLTPNGNRVHSYWRYYHSNGDIDIFTVRWDTPWNMEYTKYFASEQLIRFMYDCEDTQPNVDCGQPCRFSMRESDTHKPSVWMKRYWTVGEVIDCTNAEGTSWRNDKTPCYPWSGPGYKVQLFRKFSEDFGGSVGVRDAIETHWIILDNNNNEVRREVTVYAKGWGLVTWNVLINGERQYPDYPDVWSTTAPKVAPDFASICPEAYVPPVHVNDAHGPFLTLRDGDGVHIKPWEACPRDVDMITMHPQGGNVYAMQLPNGKYMSATNGGGSTITCDASVIGAHEKFTFQWIPGNDSYLIWCPDGVHGLDAPNLVGQYITAYYPPGGCSGQFCFHKFDEWGENKYSVWAYCNDDIGPGVFWPELSRPSGLPTYQQIVSPEIIDVLDYWICNDVVYSKTVSINAVGDGAHCYWMYCHPNGDIDWFVVKFTLPWYLEYWKYFASEQMVRHMYDCEDSQPNVDCGERCRFSMRESDTLKPSKWMKRFWTVGEIIDCSNAQGTSWHNDKTPCYPWCGPGYKILLYRKFSQDFGGLSGVRDAIEIHFIHLDNNNEEVSREQYIWAKGWGLMSWNFSINGVLQYPISYLNWIVDVPKVMPDFTSICPETYVPSVPVYDPVLPTCCAGCQL